MRGPRSELTWCINAINIRALELNSLIRTSAASGEMINAITRGHYAPTKGESTWYIITHIALRGCDARVSLMHMRAWVSLLMYGKGGCAYRPLASHQKEHPSAASWPVNFLFSAHPVWYMYCAFAARSQWTWWMYAASVHFYRASPHVTRAPRQKGLIKVNFPLIVTNNWIQTDVIVSKTWRGIKNAVRADAETNFDGPYPGKIVELN